MKRTLLSALAILVLAAWAIQGQQATASTQDTWVIRPSDGKVCDIRFTDGKRAAKLDFCGEKVVYSGDLPVDESAKLLFEALHLRVQPVHLIQEKDSVLSCVDTRTGKPCDPTTTMPQQDWPEYSKDSINCQVGGVCLEPKHKWASDLAKEKRTDGTVWRADLPSVWRETPDCNKCDNLGCTAMYCPATIHETITLDVCLSTDHDTHWRVLREGR